MIAATIVHYTGHFKDNERPKIEVLIHQFLLNLPWAPKPPNNKK